MPWRCSAAASVGLRLGSQAFGSLRRIAAVNSSVFGIAPRRSAALHAQQRRRVGHAAHTTPWRCDSTNPFRDPESRTKLDGVQQELVDRVEKAARQRSDALNSFLEKEIPVSFANMVFPVKLSTLLVPVGFVTAGLFITAVLSAAAGFLALMLPLTMVGIVIAGLAVNALAAILVFFVLATFMAPVWFSIMGAHAIGALTSLVMPVAFAAGLGAFAYKYMGDQKQRRRQEKIERELEFRRIQINTEREQQRRAQDDFAAFDERLNESFLERAPAAAADADFFSKSIVDWSVTDVADWLDSIGCGRYIPSFVSHRIDGVLLPSLTAAELRNELGVASLGDRKRILAEVDRAVERYIG
eukprot:tig00000718_g3718.t1